MRSFYFHYNKPASLQAGCPKLSVHYKDRCFVIDGIVCNVPVVSRIRKTQPRCVMAGRANSVKILNKIAVIK